METVVLEVLADTFMEWSVRLAIDFACTHTIMIRPKSISKFATALHMMMMWMKMKLNVEFALRKFSPSPMLVSDC